MPLSSGDQVGVTVLMDDSEWPQFLAVPPHTERVDPIAWIDLGNNFHGSLAEVFYITRNESSDSIYLVLWRGTTGSQADDDVARLLPIAWVEMDEFLDEEYRLHMSEAARVMLYATISARHKAYGSFDSEDEVEGGTYLDYEDELEGETYLKESEVKEILRAACADQPLLDRITLIMIEGLANIVAWKVLENGDDIRTVISENEGDLTEFVPKQMYQHVRQRVEELAKKVISEEKARMEARDEDSI